MRDLEAAEARIAELEAQVSALLLAREFDYEQLRVARDGELLGVLKDLQKDVHRMSEAVSFHLERP